MKIKRIKIFANNNEKSLKLKKEVEEKEGQKEEKQKNKTENNEENIIQELNENYFKIKVVK